MVALSVIGLIIAALLFDIVVSQIKQAIRRSRRKKRGASAVAGEAKLLESRIDAKVEPGVFHYRGQTWCHLRPDGNAVVGVNDLIHRIVGRFDEVRPPAPGQYLRRGGKAVLVRQGDNVLYLLSPLTGTVSAVNEKLATEPELPKNDPYGAGWLYSIAPEEADLDISYLMIMRRAEEWVRRETERMRAFFIDLYHKGAAVKSAPDANEFEGILERLDDKVWVIFKDQFIYQQEWRS
jgi:glycine cleavage system H protein